MMADESAAAAKPAADSYAFGDSGAARAAFGGRTVEADLAFLLPYLEPGQQLVDCGCGGGVLAVQLAEYVSPGQVVGFDFYGNAVAQAEHLAAQRGTENIRFLVASVYDAPLLGQSFDIALFCGVLAHVPEPERALRHAFWLLKPGGILAARELEKHGDWFGGPGWETIRDVNQMHADEIAAGGGDPFLGQRLKPMLIATGFEHVDVTPSFSPALSLPQVVGALFLGRLQEPEFVARVVSRGRYSAEGLQEMAGKVSAWMQDAASIAGISECTALGWKPR